MPQMNQMNTRALYEALRLIGGDMLTNVVAQLTDTLDRVERTGFEEGRAYEAELNRDDIKFVSEFALEQGRAVGFDEGFETAQRDYADGYAAGLHDAFSEVEVPEEDVQMCFEFIRPPQVNAHVEGEAYPFTAADFDANYFEQPAR